MVVSLVNTLQTDGLAYSDLSTITRMASLNIILQYSDQRDIKRQIRLCLPKKTKAAAISGTEYEKVLKNLNPSS